MPFTGTAVGRATAKPGVTASSLAAGLDSPGNTAFANRSVNAPDVGGRSFVAPFDISGGLQARFGGISQQLNAAQQAQAASLRAEETGQIQGAEEFGERSSAFARARLGKIGGFEGTFGIALQNSIAARTEKTISSIKAATTRAIETGKFELAGRLAELEADQFDMMAQLNRDAFTQFQGTESMLRGREELDINKSDLAIRQSAEARNAKESEQDEFMQAFQNNLTGETTALFQRPDGSTYTKSLGNIGQRTVFKGDGDGDEDTPFNQLISEEAQKLASMGTGLTQAIYDEALNFLIDTMAGEVRDFTIEQEEAIRSDLNNAIQAARTGVSEPSRSIDQGVTEEATPARELSPAENQERISKGMTREQYENWKRTGQTDPSTFAELLGPMWRALQ